MSRKYVKKDSIPSILFKTENQELYKSIMEIYAPVFDRITAIEMYKKGIPPPVCEICGVRLLVTKKMPSRCKKHINIDINNYFTYDSLTLKYPGTYKRWDGYKSLSDFIEIECDTHGYYTQKLRSYCNGHKCQKCYFEKKRGILKTTWEEYKSKFISIHGDKYDYSNTIYNGSTNKLNIRCNIHGEFWQQANVHANGHGCPKCAADDAHLRQSTEEYISNMRTIMAKRIKNNPSKSKNTKIELKTIDWLCSNNITFEHQYIIYDLDKTGAWVYDFYLPQYNLLIEVDGEYWHRKPESLNRDIIKNNIAAKNNILLLRLSDKNLNFSMVFAQKEEIFKHTSVIMSERINYVREKYGINIGKNKTI